MRYIIILLIVFSAASFGNDVFLSPSGDVAIEEGDTLQITLRDGLTGEIFLRPVSRNYTEVITVSDIATDGCSFDTYGLGVGRYFLIAVVDGEKTVGPVVSINDTDSDAAFLEQPKMYVQPNPFDLSEHSGTLTFMNVPAGSAIKIYDMAGKVVSELAIGNTEWNGRNDRGDLVAAGTYMFYVGGGSLEFTGKFAVIK